MQFDQVAIGMKVKSLKPFNNVPEGSTGEIIELYGIGKHLGFTVAWLDSGVRGIEDGFSENELGSLEFLN